MTVIRRDAPAPAHTARGDTLEAAALATLQKAVLLKDEAEDTIERLTGGAPAPRRDAIPEGRVPKAEYDALVAEIAKEKAKLAKADAARPSLMEAHAARMRGAFAAYQAPTMRAATVPKVDSPGPAVSAFFAGLPHDDADEGPLAKAQAAHKARCDSAFAAAVFPVMRRG
jgi:hypothetical protein